MYDGFSIAFVQKPASAYPLPVASISRTGIDNQPNMVGTTDGNFNINIPGSAVLADIPPFGGKIEITVPNWYG